MSQNNHVHAVYPPQVDLANLSVDALVATGSVEQKRRAVYLLLRSLYGDRPAKEVGIYDPELFIYGYFMPPSQREELRFLEDPTLEQRLRDAEAEPTVPWREAMKQAGIPLRDEE